MPAIAEETARPEPQRFTFAVGPRRVGRGYSRWVQVAKRALPLLAGVVIVLIIGWARLDPQDVMPPGGVRISARDAEALTMLQPRYVGTDSGNRPFTVTADSAAQTSPSVNTVDLARPRADLTLEGGAGVSLTAAEGAFDRDSNTVALRGGVALNHDRGYTLSTDAIDIDLKAGRAVASTPVHGEGPLGRLDGQGLRMERQGEVVYLTGRSSMLIRPDAARGIDPQVIGAQDSGGAPTPRPAPASVKPAPEAPAASTTETSVAPPRPVPPPQQRSASTAQDDPMPPKPTPPPAARAKP